MRASWMVLVVVLIGCGTGGDAVVSGHDVADSANAVELPAELTTFDDAMEVATQDQRVEPDMLIFDVAPETLEPQCAAGEGCFLDKCTENAQCASGWCVEHMGEGVCSKACQEECPTGWSCKQVGADGPDIQYICVSQHANLCRPCTSGSDCKSPGGAEDVCVDYAVEGSFCGGACTTGDDCPWGFSCVTTLTVDGISTQQCVADAGSCPCTGKSAALALWTPCEVTNEWGACGGKRVCGAEGLGDCDAATATQESCNGLDDDCDGDIDEPVLDPPASLCDDGNPCTVDTCNGAAGCAHETLTKGECIDGDSCTVGDHCDAGICVGSPVDCNDNNPCTDDSCDGFGGCSFADNVADCDDEDPCTVADECNGGICAGFAIPCDCQEDGDCAALEDGNLCNGTLFCDQTQLPYQCRVDEASVVKCPLPAPGPNAVCLAAVCVSATGVCGLEPANEGLACSDGDACTVGDLCAEGECVGGAAAVCADNNGCTDDSCDPQGGCKYVDNLAACNDGDACTTSDQCAAGQCVGDVALDCDDGNVCTDDKCDGAAGCQSISNAAACDDGNACTTGDLCGNGVCGFSGFLKCDDGNPCTTDGCDPLVGCTHKDQLGVCSDGNLCTVGDVCIAGQCVAGQTVSCDDGNPCTDDSCDQAGLCVHLPNAAPCTDGNACTLGDHCDGGVCLFAGLAACDDDDVCTTDSCDPGQGCLHLLNSAPCNDGDVCTTGDHCHLGSCIAAGSLTCNDGNACTDDSCEPESGCFHAPNTVPCDDGNLCTKDDVCAGGQCKGGSMVICDDGNACTANFCDLAQGCVTINKAGLCDDGNACTVESKCADGVCGGGIAFTCDDGNGCTDDSCDPDDGCIFVNNQAPCSDADACTTGDFCNGGSCQPGGATNCDDSKICTEDSCNQQTGCVYTPVDDETECGADLHCVDGECVADCTTGSQTFNYTGGAQTFAVPTCVKSLAIEVWGAEGGLSASMIGGKGGYSKGTLVVNGGETLHIYVGGKGGTAPNGVGGWNGGGLGNTQESNRGAGGGGASDVRTVGGSWNDATSLNSRVIVAGGGGGGWGYSCCNPGVGGHGGGTTGGTAPAGGGAEAGTQNGSGCCGGAGFGVGGSNHTYGGGGGGWWGGGSANGCCAGAGAGGSGYVGGVSNGVTTAGSNTGNGKVVIAW